MKIAVLLSGQLRQWEYAKENQKWFWETSGATQIDYFIHTWSYSGDRKGVSQEYEWKDIDKSEFKLPISFFCCIKYIISKRSFKKLLGSIPSFITSRNISNDFF